MCVCVCVYLCLVTLQTLALEQAQNNITVNAICPGYVLTDLVKNQIDDTARYGLLVYVCASM